MFLTARLPLCSLFTAWLPFWVHECQVLWQTPFIAIAWEKPKVLLGCLVRMINTAPQFGFLVFLPSFYITTVGFTLRQW